MASYRIVRPLGQGGMGAVYEGVHEQLGRRAAIKVLLPELSRDQEMVTRFFNEARAVNIVGHPGIVSIYEMGQLRDGTVFIVMEYLEGETLTDRLEQLAGRPVTEALRLCRQVASALQAAHRKGVIHRDLKPDNIMIVPDPDMPGGERTKILDFGVAKVAEAQAGSNSLRTRTGIVLGTPKYMAPEQCRGVGGITDKADVYSLGVMLYQLLAGRPPFLAEGVGDLIVQQISEPPPPLRRLEPDVPERVAQLVHAMLAKKPEERPSMAEVAAALERLELDPERAALPAVADPSLAVTPSMFIDDLPHTATEAMAQVEGPPVRHEPGAPADTTDALSPASLLRKSRGGDRVVLGLVVALILGGAAFYGLRGGLRPPAPAPTAAPAQNRDGEAALLLLSADGDLTARRWDAALGKANQVLAMADLSPATRQLAEERRVRADRERKALETFQRFNAALEKKDLDEAMQLYHQLPAESIYRPEAKGPYEKAFPAFAATHMRRARAARGAGRCDEAKAQLDAILAVEPGYLAARREKDQPCGEEEEEEEEEEPSALPRPE